MLSQSIGTSRTNPNPHPHPNPNPNPNPNQVGEVDFRYFEETPMAARARLAGFTDPEDEGEEDEELSVEEAMRRRREQRRLDAELANMLDDDGEITLY